MRTRTLLIAFTSIGLPALLLQACSRSAPPADSAVSTASSTPINTALIDKTIHDNALLAKLDQQVTQLLTQALANATDKPALQTAQQAWLTQRNAQCHDKPTSRDHPEASINHCLLTALEHRINDLVELAYPPLTPVAVREIPTTLVQQVLAPSDCQIAQAAFADTGEGPSRALAIEVHCGSEQRRVWVIDASGQHLVPATPALGTGDANSELVYHTGTDLLWQNGTLFVATSMETKPDDSAEPYWDARYFSVTPNGQFKAIALLPSTVQQRLENPADGFSGDAYTFTGTDNLLDESVHTVGGALVWADAVDDDDAVVYSKPLDGKGPAQAITRLPIGGLGYVLSDSKRLLYPSEFGLLLHLPNTQITRHIAGTGLHHIPLAWDPATRQLAWFSEVACSGGDMTPHDHLCIATLPDDMP